MPSSEPRATIGTFASARTTTLLTFAAAIIGVVLGVAVTLDLNAPNTSNTSNTPNTSNTSNTQHTHTETNRPYKNTDICPTRVHTYMQWISSAL